MNRNLCWGDVAQLKYGKSIRDYPEVPSDSHRFRVFGTNGPIGYHTCPLVDRSGIIIGRKGAYRGVHYSDLPFFVIDTAYYLDIHDPDVDVKWAYYQLLTVDINRMDSGSAIPSTKREDFDAVPVRIPAKSTQQRIAGILSAYDDLIENNRRRMALLEESARLLYQEWFVRLRFPGHEHTRIVNSLPNGWEQKKLGERITLNYGKALKAEVRVDGPFPVYGSSGVVGSHDKALVKGPGIILGRKGNVGSVYWCNTDFYPIDTVYFVSPEASNLYLFYALMHMHFISTDVAVPGLNRDLAYSRPLTIPPSWLVSQFLDEVVPIHNQLKLLEQLNEKLAAARDLLLPRLMSGGVVV